MKRRFVAFAYVSACIGFCAALGASGAAAIQTHFPQPEYALTDRLIVRLKSAPVAVVQDVSAAAPRSGKSTAIAQAAVRAARDAHAEHRQKTTARLQVLTTESLTPLRTMGDGSHVIRLSRRMSANELQTIIKRISTDPEILEVLPDRLFFPQATPTDPLYPNQWNLAQANGINMPGAWDITTGSARA